MAKKGIYFAISALRGVHFNNSLIPGERGHLSRANLSMHCFDFAGFPVTGVQSCNQQILQVFSLNRQP